MSVDMTSLPAARHRYSYSEYLAYERDSGMKHEYDAGDIVAMAGGSPRHNALASRVSAALENGRRSGCLAFQSDQRIRIVATGRATYPDASLVCGPIERDPADPSGTTITNPALIVEVLSPSTEEDDRGAKWHHYQLIPSLRCSLRIRNWGTWRGFYRFDEPRTSAGRYRQSSIFATLANRNRWPRYCAPPNPKALAGRRLVLQSALLTALR
jgi:hypothetical protein